MSKNVTDYDLTAFAEARSRFDLPTRIVVLLFGAGLLIEWTLLLRNLAGRLMAGAQAGSLVNTAVAAAGLAAGPALFLVCLYLGVVRLRKAPTSARVDAESLEFRYADGRTVSVRWNEPNINILVRDDRLNPRVNPLLAVDLKLRAGGPIPVPVGLAEEVRNMADHLGLTVVENKGGSAFDSIRGSRLVSIRSGVTTRDHR